MRMGRRQKAGVESRRLWRLEGATLTVRHPLRGADEDGARTAGSKEGAAE